MSLKSLRARARVMRRTPFPMVLDKLGLMRHPYKVSARKGLTVELRPGVRGERYVFYEVFMKSCYLSAGQRIRPGDTVIDIGANVGFFSILAASLVGPTGSVIAIEPHPETFAQLQRNVEVSGMKNIRARQAAVAETKGTCSLFFGDIPTYSSLFSTVDGNPPELQSREVATTTLEDVMKEESLVRCNYLKVDCEGAEYAILESISPEVAQRIDQITMEIHHIPGHETSELDRRLSDLGFLAQTRGKLSSYVRKVA
jgi:FkbM family methyltransferase